MNTISRILMIMLLAGAIAGTLVLKQRRSSEPPESNETAAVAEPTETAPGSDSDAVLSANTPNLELPRLVDLGADQCIPCKMMAPILEALKTDYAGKLDVEFIDVWKNPDAGATYGVEVIPTQIFYSATGKELRRHTGFIGREDILATWKELGVDLGLAPEKEAAYSPK